MYRRYMGTYPSMSERMAVKCSVAIVSAREPIVAVDYYLEMYFSKMLLSKDSICLFKL